MYLARLYTLTKSYQSKFRKTGEYILILFRIVLNIIIIVKMYIEYLILFTLQNILS